MKNFSDYTYFLYIGKNPKYSFRNYTDPDTGQERGFVIGYDKNNQPILKEWYFDYSAKRQVRVSDKEIDKTGQKAIDFLRNSPEFYSNPNGYEALYMFKEINEERDAVSAVDTRRKLIEAQSKALELKGKELEQIANIIGVFTKGEALQTQRVLDFAANFSDKFLELVADPALKLRALIEKAINDGVFKLDGKMVKWEGKSIGADKDEALANLSKDEKLLKAVELHLQKFGSA